MFTFDGSSGTVFPLGTPGVGVFDLLTYVRTARRRLQIYRLQILRGVGWVLNGMLARKEIPSLGVSVQLVLIAWQMMSGMLIPWKLRGELSTISSVDHSSPRGGSGGCPD